MQIFQQLRTFAMPISEDRDKKKNVFSLNVCGEVYIIGCPLVKDSMANIIIIFLYLRAPLGYSSKSTLHGCQIYKALVF